MNRLPKGFPIIPTLIIFVVSIVLSFWGGTLLRTSFFSHAVSDTENSLTWESPKNEKNAIPNKDLINTNQLWTVWDELRKDMYLSKDVEAKKVEYGLIKGALSSLGDQHTMFFDPDEAKNFHISLDQSLSGIGAEIGFRGKLYYIKSTIKGSPAQKSGLKMDDIFLEVNGKKVETLEYEELVKSIRGPKGSSVELTVMRDGESMKFTIIRDDIKVPSVEAEMLSDGIGKIILNQFSIHTGEEFQAVYNELVKQGMKKMILDVRGNGGGYLEQAIFIVSAFLPEGNVIQREYKSENNTRMMVPVSGKIFVDPNMPLVILIDGESASASEITAGTLRDYGRAYLIGETTFGKGTVQTEREFPDGSSMKYTIGKWFTGKGNDIDKIGVKPDLEVEPSEDKAKDIQREKAEEYLKTKNLP